MEIYRGLKNLSYNREHEEVSCEQPIERLKTEEDYNTILNMISEI